MASKPTRKYWKPEEMPVNSRPLTWEEWPVNNLLGPVDFRIKPSTHLKHCDLLNIHLPWFETYWNLFPWEADSSTRVHSAYYGRLNAGIQPYLQYEFYQPARVGQPLSGTWVITDKFIKRGKKFFACTNETRDDKGE
ncbi:hypothetical protein ACFLTS_06730, partial [Chloroflexota bacterium]